MSYRSDSLEKFLVGRAVLKGHNKMASLRLHRREVDLSGNVVRLHVYELSTFDAAVFGPKKSIKLFF